MNTVDAATSSQLTVALVVGAYAGSIHPATSHLMTRRFIPWALGHRDTRALSRLQLFLYVHCDVDGSSNASLVPARAHRDVSNPLRRPGVPLAWQWPARCVTHPQTAAAMEQCGRRRWLKCELEFVPNIGREAHMYLHHIVKVHGSADLADLTFFIQEGEPFGLERMWSCIGGLYAPDVQKPPQQLHDPPDRTYPPFQQFDHLWGSYQARGTCKLQDGGPFPPDELYFASPLHATCHGEAPIRPDAKQPDLSLESALGFLNLACGLPTATVTDGAIERCAEFGRRPRMQTKLGALLVRKLDGVCPLIAALQKQPEWQRPARGTFVAHRSALHARPAALWKSLLALSVSEEMELEAFYTRPPCSARCGRPTPSGGTYLCAKRMLAGDVLAYLLEPLWALLLGVHEASAETRCVGIENNHTLARPAGSWASIGSRSGGMWCKHKGTR